MNIMFSWCRHADDYDPVSESDLLNEDGVSLLDCLLMDSGGLSYWDSIPWLNEGIERIKSVASGQPESSDWNRETWGVEFRKGKAKIYSLYDEAYSQTIGLEGFLRVLQEWVNFLQSQPDDREAETLSFSIHENI